MAHPRARLINPVFDELLLVENRVTALATLGGLVGAQTHVLSCEISIAWLMWRYYSAGDPHIFGFIIVP
jgi:hypothetical protein